MPRAGISTNLPYEPAAGQIDYSIAMNFGFHEENTSLSGNLELYLLRKRMVNITAFFLIFLHLKFGFPANGDTALLQGSR